MQKLPEVRYTVLLWITKGSAALGNGVARRVLVVATGRYYRRLVPLPWVGGRWWRGPSVGTVAVVTRSLASAAHRPLRLGSLLRVDGVPWTVTGIVARAGAEMSAMAPTPVVFVPWCSLLGCLAASAHRFGHGCAPGRSGGRDSGEAAGGAAC